METLLIQVSVRNFLQDLLLLQLLPADSAGIYRSGVWDRGLAPPGVCPMALIPPSSQSKFLEHYHLPILLQATKLLRLQSPSTTKHDETLLKVKLISAGMHRRSQHTHFSCFCLQFTVSQVLKAGYCQAPAVS